MKGYFENELGRVYIDPVIISRVCILPEIALSNVLVLPNGPVSTEPYEQVNRKGIDRYIQVDFTPDGEVLVQVRLLVRYGPSIRSSVRLFQEKVARRVEASTGLKATRVDVKIDGIYHAIEPSEPPPVMESRPRWQIENKSEGTY